MMQFKIVFLINAFLLKIILQSDVRAKYFFIIISGRRLRVDISVLVDI